MFNDGAYEGITARAVRDEMLIPLEHGKPVRFGADGHRGVVVDAQHGARLVEVADVGEDAILVHDEARDDPGMAFMLSRLSTGPHEPTPIGVFRAVERPSTAPCPTAQLAQAQERSGPGDLGALLHSRPTWTVD